MNPYIVTAYLRPGVDGLFTSVAYHWTYQADDLSHALEQWWDDPQLEDHQYWRISVEEVRDS